MLRTFIDRICPCVRVEPFDYFILIQLIWHLLLHSVNSSILSAFQFLQGVILLFVSFLLIFFVAVLLPSPSILLYHLQVSLSIIHASYSWVLLFLTFVAPIFTQDSRLYVSSSFLALLIALIYGGGIGGSHHDMMTFSITYSEREWTPLLVLIIGLIIRSN